MFLISFFCIFSLLFSSNLSMFLPYEINNLSILTPAFHIVSICLIYPYFNKNNKKYLLFLAIYGLIFDITITNTLFLNIIIFVIIGYILTKINKTIILSKVNVGFISIFLLTTYNIINFIFLKIVNYTNYQLKDLYYLIINSITLNFIYATLSFIILENISLKYKIKKLN